MNSILTEKSAAILNGEETVWVSAAPVVSKAEEPQSGRRSSRTFAARESLENCEKELLKALKAVRTKVAGEKNVPAYIVFSDKTLIELATYLPHNLSEIRQISGFGDYKVNQYGLIFLTVVLDYCKTNGLASRIDLKPSRKTAP